MLSIASQSFTPYGAVMALGFVIGIFGHIIKSRLVIVTGIIIVALGSCYFAYITLKIQ